MKLRYVTTLLVLFFFPLQAWTLTLDEESKYGREAYLQMAGSSKFYSDPYVCIQMAIIKRRLEAAADLPFPIKLTIIDRLRPQRLCHGRRLRLYDDGDSGAGRR